MTSGLAEVNYNFAHFGKLKNKGWQATASVGFDRGTQVGDNLGFALTLQKRGLLLK